MKLLFESADSVDLNDAGNCPQLRPDDPVLNRPQVAGAVGFALRRTRLRLSLDREHVNFAQARCYRPHRCLDAGGQLIPDLLNAFVDQLSGEIDIGTIPEDYRDLAEAVTRLRPRIFESRQSPHGGLDRKRDALLDFQRRIARCPAIDLDLDV